ncbi:MAG: flavodoxin domain-containing protein [Armatimonadetes bacterium]|nr:flavodoxin domain-containing protein [Armatimonadota bacterium]
MPAEEIIADVYWIGAIDWNVRNFHGYTYNTKRGTTFNAYLILDDKITLIDTVFKPFAQEMLENISSIVSPEKIDYIIVNHLEPDHSGALPRIFEFCPKAKIFGSVKSKEGLYKHYYNQIGLDFQVVKTGDKLHLGKKTLTFIETPMIHWPDSMFTYLIEGEILFSNDAFGQHWASMERFDDQVNETVLMDEALKYYANILWPFSSLILRKIEEIQKLNIPLKIIAPSHGIIWRKNLNKIIQTYLAWAKNETKLKVVIAYETMYGSTEIMAKNIAKGIIDSQVEVKIFDINQIDRTEIIKEMFEAKAYLIGSSTHDNAMLPNMAGFLKFLRGLKPKGKFAGVFGSYGWGGGALKDIEEVLKETGIEIIQNPLAIQYVPDENQIKNCYEYGKDFILKLKKENQQNLNLISS